MILWMALLKPEMLDWPASSPLHFSLLLNLHIFKMYLTVPFTYLLSRNKLLQRITQLILDETLSPGVSSGPNIFGEHERHREDACRWNVRILWSLKLLPTSLSWYGLGLHWLEYSKHKKLSLWQPQCFLTCLTWDLENLPSGSNTLSISSILKG